MIRLYNATSRGLKLVADDVDKKRGKTLIVDEAWPLGDQLKRAVKLFFFIMLNVEYCEDWSSDVLVVGESLRYRKSNKLAGELLEREIRVHLAHARRSMTKAMKKHLAGEGDLKPIEHYLDASIMTNGLNRAFSTRAWSHPFRKMERISGVVANLGRANPLQTLIDLRRTRQQVLYTGKVGDARYPHPSHWGRVCFLSTPDGENCGLVKNMSLLGLVSTQILEPVVEKFYDCGMEELMDDTSTPLCGKQKVLLNGDWVGLCNNSESFVAELKSVRRQNDFLRQMEIKRDKDDNEVRIFTDAGRLLRPLLVVENLHKLKQDKPTQYILTIFLTKGFSN